MLHYISNDPAALKVGSIVLATLVAVGLRLSWSQPAIALCFGGIFGTIAMAAVGCNILGLPLFS